MKRAIQNRIEILLTSIILSLSMLACDPYGGYQYLIDNKSDSTLYVNYILIDNDTLKNVMISPRNITLLNEFRTINGLNDYGSEFLNQNFDSLSIFIDSLNKIPVKKDYLNRENWSYVQNQTGSILFVKAGENIYTLIIENKDLR
jgi:hypothetical protein